MLCEHAVALIFITSVSLENIWSYDFRIKHILDIFLPQIFFLQVFRTVKLCLELPFLLDLIIFVIIFAFWNRALRYTLWLEFEEVFSAVIAEIS